MVVAHGTLHPELVDGRGVVHPDLLLLGVEPAFVGVIVGRVPLVHAFTFSHFERLKFFDDDENNEN